MEGILSVLHVVGFCIVVLVGGGGGVLLFLREKKQWAQMYAFNRFLAYLESSIRYRAIPGEDLIRTAAAWPELSSLGLDSVSKLRDVAPPQAFGVALRREIVDCLCTIEAVPRESACETLLQVLRLCKAAEEERSHAMQEAGRLYPRLGLCAGLLAALFFL